jgi:hypothetical protein
MVHLYQPSLGMNARGTVHSTKFAVERVERDGVKMPSALLLFYSANAFAALCKIMRFGGVIVDNRSSAILWFAITKLSIEDL